MDMKRVMFWLAIVAFFLWTSGALGQEGGRVQGNPSALRLHDNLTYATNMARSWERDAMLVGVEAIGVIENGTVNIGDPTRPEDRIVYRFFSPTVLATTQDPVPAHRQVVLRTNRIELAADDECRAVSALPTDFKDLDDVWKAARRKGAAGRAEVTLALHADGGLHPCCFAFAAGALTLRIDALTCEVVE